MKKKVVHSEHSKVRYYQPNINNFKDSDSFTILSIWALGLAVSRISESNCKLMSPEHYFNDKSVILLHPVSR